MVCAKFKWRVETQRCNVFMKIRGRFRNGSKMERFGRNDIGGGRGCGAQVVETRKGKSRS